MDGDEAMELIADVARADVTELYDGDGKLLPVRD
jgi:hypothetical protein